MVDLDIEGCRIDARGECVDLDTGGRAADIERREGAIGQGADAAGAAKAGELLLQLALQTLELGEQAAGEAE